MTQDVRMATIQSRLISARQSLHMATLLSEFAREPTLDEADEINLLMTQVMTELKRIRKNLLLDMKVL